MLERDAPGTVVLSNGDTAPDTVRLTKTWNREFCRSKLVNGGTSPVRVREAILFSLPHNYSPETAFYGEGFQMLSQTGGTMRKPMQLGGYSDVEHYRLPQPKGAVTVYGLLLVGSAAEPVLTRLAARFLMVEANGMRAKDPVAHFHLSNGARVERLNMAGDTSDKGAKESATLMVNYLYDPGKIEDWHEDYAGEGKRNASTAVRKLARGWS